MITQFMPIITLALLDEAKAKSDIQYCRNLVCRSAGDHKKPPLIPFRDRVVQIDGLRKQFHIPRNRRPFWVRQPEQFEAMMCWLADVLLDQPPKRMRFVGLRLSTSRVDDSACPLRRATASARIAAPLFVARCLAILNGKSSRGDVLHLEKRTKAKMFAWAWCAMRDRGRA
jgi:hypothetical protein